MGKDITWDDLKKNYDACVLAVGLIDPNSVRAEGEKRKACLWTSVLARHRHGYFEGEAGRTSGRNRRRKPAIDCSREALRQGAVEVTMITVEAHPEMPAVPEVPHYMLEEGVELIHGRAVTAVHGNGKVEALESHPARFSAQSMRLD